MSSIFFTLATLGVVLPQAFPQQAQVPKNAVAPKEARSAFNEAFTSNPATSGIWDLSYRDATNNYKISWSPGDLRIQKSTRQLGGGVMYKSKQQFTGDIDVSYTLNHQGSDEAWVGLIDKSGMPTASINLGTNHWTFFGNGTEVSQPAGPYMNRKVTLQIKMQRGQVQLFADGKLMGSMAGAATEPMAVAFRVRSQPDSIADNITDFYNITVR
jgi:hypothetical protein